MDLNDAMAGWKEFDWTEKGGGFRREAGCCVLTL